MVNEQSVVVLTLEKRRSFIDKIRNLVSGVQKERFITKIKVDKLNETD